MSTRRNSYLDRKGDVRGISVRRNTKRWLRTSSESIEVLVSFPSRVKPVEEVQYRVIGEVRRSLMYGDDVLVCVDGEVEVALLEMDRPTM